MSSGLGRPAAGSPYRTQQRSFSVTSAVSRLAGQDDAQAKREALGRLLGRYLPALVAHLIHGKGLAPEAGRALRR